MIPADDMLFSSTPLFPLVRTGYIKHLPQMTLQQSTFHIAVFLDLLLVQCREGIQRVTRHPLNLAFALIAAAHMLSNPFVGDWIFFGGFLVYGLLSAIHQDRRTLASGGEEVARFQSETSLVPFAAIFSGKQRLGLDEYRPIALVASLVVCGAIWYFHPSIFGGYGG